MTSTVSWYCVFCLQSVLYWVSFHMSCHLVIEQYRIIEYIFDEYMASWLFMAKPDILAELHNTCITSLFYIAWLHHILFLSKYNIGCKKQGPCTLGGLTVVLHRPAHFQFEEEILNHVEDKPLVSTWNIAVTWMLKCSKLLGYNGPQI